MVLMPLHRKMHSVFFPYWVVSFSYMECARAGGGKEQVGELACGTSFQ